MERVLEPDNAIAVLGPGLAEEFLRLAVPQPLPKAEALRQRISTHLQNSIQAMAQNEFIDLHLATCIAERCLELLDHYPAFTPDAQAAVIGAAQYFIQSQDTYHDTTSSLGFEDDAMVVNYVINNISTGVQRVQLKS